MSTLLLAVWLPSPLPGQAGCNAVRTAPRLDHVIIVTRNLDSTAAHFSSHGFRFKNGRLHANNLLNRHIKFRDGSEIELMTVIGQPGDSMAVDYARLLDHGEGGVYVALSVSTIKPVAAAAQRLTLKTRHSASGPWQFLSFPSNDAAAVFFTSGSAPVQDPDSIFQHEPKVHGLSTAWVEAGFALADLLRSLGAAHCGRERAPDGRTGERWALANGNLVLVPAPANQRPRVLGVVLATDSSAATVAYPIPSFWIRR